LVKFNAFSIFRHQAKREGPGTIGSLGIPAKLVKIGKNLSLPASECRNIVLYSQSS
jgi:hypothetical protein